VDEVPYGSSTIFTTGATNTPDFDPRDLDRVEVLRGPQGTLYGADSLGGVLKYVTTPPNLSRMEGRIQAGIVGVADGGTGYDVSGMLNVPIVSDKLALRITGYSRLDPGYIDDVRRGLHDINESDVYGGRAT
ncbi:TonB-dependent receptor plug domain-containing protein, partial [Escherichia coli]|uniref:TonB-dependent receptor plug domain-containing protein n=12 Tax=Pseudomonadota TaxID=1224 RepID=UPI0015C46B34|nr:TonB-dependent receptor plug domain-containing protein [Escherichia coli]